jgi:mannose-1-phosphate guanylyltransferase
VGDRSLVQATVDRVVPLVPPERILIITEASHAEDLRAQLPEIPPENVVVEPRRRGTATAVGLAAYLIARREPGATMASLHSDAVVLDDEGFRRSLGAAFDLAETDRWLVTLGIRPTSPHTGMGYIEPGPAIGDFQGLSAHRALRFVEKPDAATAERYVADGYLWNPGMFIWRVDVVLEEFARLLPEIHGALGAAVEGAGGAADALETAYAALPVQTIDYGIMEWAERVATIPSDFGWSDVGSWAELLNIAPKDPDGNFTRGDCVAVESRDSLVYSSTRPVFTLGVQDLVIVDLPDALLVCHRAQAERVRELVERLSGDPSTADLV